MLKKILYASLLCFIAPAYSIQISPNSKEVMKSSSLATVTKEYSSQKQYSRNMQWMNRVELAHRSVDYPTQIVRVEGTVENLFETCDDVTKKIESFYTNYITDDHFIHNTAIKCIYDPNTQYASNFSINSYFDPINDESIAYLKDFLATHNGKDLLGTTFKVENAKGLIVSLNIQTGMQDSNEPSILDRVKTDVSNYYFPSNYVMTKELISDIDRRFYSNDQTLVIPFMTKWFDTSDIIYRTALRNSNYVELHPELIFLMDSGPKIFTPGLRLYFYHECRQYENQRCL